MNRVEQKEYRGWKHAHALSNGTVELTVSADVGPRILRYGFCGGENQFHEFNDQAGQTSGDEFRLYGGHRLWVWPEVGRTYFPDNHPVEVREIAGALKFCAPVEANSPGTHLRKQLELRLAPAGTQVQVLHTITNLGDAATRLAPWAPTVLRPGGRAILPFPPCAAMDKDHYQSVAPLTLWSFTDFTDGRWIFGQEFLQLKQEERPSGRFAEQMSGLFNLAEWGAYYRAGFLFIKRAAVVSGGQYPDYGCNFEIFTNPDFLELETLGPIVLLQPGESTTHTEHWWLFQNVGAGDGDGWIRECVLPRVRQTTSDTL